MERQAHLPRRRHSVSLSVKIMGAVALVLIGINILIGLPFPVPNVVGRVEEFRFERFLSSHPTHADVVTLLRGTLARWHQGRDFDYDLDVPPDPSDKCSKDCATALQVGFGTWYMFCFGAADRVTVLFDVRDRVSSWTVRATGNGC
jgi:hypothetical protein